MSRSHFVCEQIDNFDARMGYSRCCPSGVAASVGRQSATADLWWDDSKDVVVRIESSGYRYSFRGRLGQRPDVPMKAAELERFSYFVWDMLLEWMVDGVDGPPEPVVEKGS